MAGVSRYLLKGRPAPRQLPGASRAGAAMAWGIALAAIGNLARLLLPASVMAPVAGLGLGAGVIAIAHLVFPSREEGAEGPMRPTTRSPLTATALRQVEDGITSGFIVRPEVAAVIVEKNLAGVLVRSMTTSSVHVGLYDRDVGVWSCAASAYGGSVESLWRVLDEDDASDDPLGVGIIGFTVDSAPGGSVLVRNGSSTIRVPLIEGRWGLHAEWAVRRSEWKPEIARVG